MMPDTQHIGQANKLYTTTIPQSLHRSQADKIPDELKQLKQWVVWRYDLNGDGKQTKIPYRANNMGKAKSNDSGTWATFKDA